MTKVFVSYRREDTAGEARALFNELSTKLGKDSVFMDVDNIALGRDFRQVLQEHLDSCDLLLVIVGRGWLDVKNASGRIRLGEPSDFVRLEIESALKRNIPVTPVLVQGAQMPTVDQLPADIKDFTFRNGFELSHNRWESDVAEMCKRLGLGKGQASGTIRKVDTSSGETPADDRTQVKVARTEAPAAQQRNGNHRLAAVVATVMAIAAAGAGFLYYRTIVEEDARLEQARLETANAKAEGENRIAALKAESDKARADAEAAKVVADAKAAKALADAEAAKVVADAKAAKALADAKAANDRADAAREERERDAAAQAKKDRLAAEERDRALKQQNPTPLRTRPTDNAENAANTAGRWQENTFPPPNGGRLVFTITADGNPACASYDGRNCLWGQKMGDIDLTRVRPLACGAAHLKLYGVTGFEDPKHWCNLALRARQPAR